MTVSPSIVPRDHGRVWHAHQSSGYRPVGSIGEERRDRFFTADNERLSGSLTTDSISPIAATLENGSSLTGTISTAALSLDTTSTWTVTGDPALTGLSDAGGIAGTTMTNIIGNGHTVTYDRSLAANRGLWGKTYSLVIGGSLAPK